tara:strand:+ start:402 stop:962 length:561 start_codon:yes stop_codon:yes gene_type:complete
MNILKKPLLIGLIVISSLVTIFLINSNSTMFEKKHEKIFLKSNNDSRLDSISFFNSEGAEFFLSDFKGKVLLVNLWATWCAPCRIEMPSLDRLQKILGDDNFQVIAIAVEKTDISKIIEFYQEANIQNLIIYHDKSTKSGLYAKATGLPFTLLIGRDGKEEGRRDGPWEWDSPEILSIIKKLKEIN